MKEPTQEGHLSSFLAFVGKVVVVHTVTYFVFGLIMSSLLDYGSLFRQEVVRDFMRPIESSYVALGPLIQPVRGFFRYGLFDAQSPKTGAGGSSYGASSSYLAYSVLLQLPRLRWKA